MVLVMVQMVVVVMVCLCVVLVTTGRCAVFGGAGQSVGGVFACGIGDGVVGAGVCCNGGGDGGGYGDGDGMFVCSGSDNWSLCRFWWSWSECWWCLRVALVMVQLVLECVVWWWWWWWWDR